MEHVQGFSDRPAHQGYEGRINTATPETWADTLLDRLIDITVEGLDRAYLGEPETFSADFYGGDLPWHPDVSDAVCIAMREDPRWQVWTAWWGEHFTPFPPLMTHDEMVAAGLLLRSRGTEPDWHDELNARAKPGDVQYLGRLDE